MDGPVVQMEEQTTLNRRAAGSSPAGATVRLRQAVYGDNHVLTTEGKMSGTGYWLEVETNGWSSCRAAGHLHSTVERAVGCWEAMTDGLHSRTSKAAGKAPAPTGGSHGE